MNKHEPFERPEIDKARVDDATLALLYLVISENRDGITRAWKSSDWETMNRLHEQGMIYDPVGKAKSVHLTPEGFKKSKELFASLFGRQTQGANEMATQTVVQFHAELIGYKPQMWRRFQVAGDNSVAMLGYIVMTMFEMKASHLLSIEHHRHRSTPGGKVSRKTELVARYGFPSEDSLVEEVDAATVKLSQLDLSLIDRLLVWYDFGDDWKVLLTPDKILEGPGIPEKELPRVLEGKGLGIIEDCGGVWGLADIAEAFQKKEGRNTKISATGWALRTWTWRPST